MEIPPPFQQHPADPKFIDQIVNQIKSQGTFDQWRRECLADVDTKPAYQNLTFRVDSAVASFLGKQRWRPDMVKNQVRENLRKNMHELGFIDKGVDRIVEQVVQPKVLPLFHPAVENAIYDFLGIKNPRTENKVAETTTTTNTTTLGSPKKAFRPMPVSVPCRDKEDGTPPPGEEFEAITPSSESRCGSISMKKDLADDVSDVSMDESRPPLERICSPISPQSSERNRVGSALSAISSGDDLPSAVTSDEFHDNTNKLDERPPSPSSNEEEDEDDDDDFSSPEFEKLEINNASVRSCTVTPVPGEEPEENKQENDPVADDHYRWRPKIDRRDPDREPDEDPGDLSSKKIGNPAVDQVSRPSVENHQPTAESTTEISGKKLADSDKIITHSSSKDKSRSHKSDRRDKSKKERDRQKDREKRRERERRRHKSSSHDKKRSHRDRDRDRNRSSSHRKSGQEKRKEMSISPLPALHPKAYLWKRPAEKPKALWDYLARFPDQVFEETCSSDSVELSDVSVSSVSSYQDSDAESAILLVLSEVEVDSEIEETIVQSGGRVVYQNNEIIESDYTPASDDRSESCLRDQQLNINNNKRVRKLNTRYSDSYVGSELRKIITTEQRSLNKARENQENCMQDSSSPEEIQEDYPPPDAKRLKTADQQPPLPSSPESVQSDLPQHVPVSTPPPADVQQSSVVVVTDEDAINKDTISPRKSKQPQQRYDDADLYKPRPVITPSSRRSRRHDDS